ncbi:MAG: hypothetical protein HYR95_00875 [Candidatus Colwellbacteria bacterium]|nr:hypothetical protein [Candidatus Colwellbacteria bacterium]
MLSLLKQRAIQFLVFAYVIGLAWWLFGRGIFFFSAGVIAWGMGSVIYGYYNIALEVPVPYPSFGDIGYSLSYFFYAIGLINLGKGIGAGYKLRTLKGKIAIIGIPILGLALTYYMFITVARGGEFGYQTQSLTKLFFDIAYPLGDAVVVIGIVLIYGLSFGVFGGRFRWPVNLLLVGQLLQYFGDFNFSYGTTQGTYYFANWGDLLFVHAVLLIAIGVNALDIQGVSSRVRAELVAFAPRATEAINNLALEIIKGQESIIGLVAWDEATRVPGLNIDVRNNSLSVEGNPKDVLEKLAKRYEELFGEASLRICKDVTRKFLSQLPPEQIPNILQ